MLLMRKYQINAVPERQANLAEGCGLGEVLSQLDVLHSLPKFTTTGAEHEFQALLPSQEAHQAIMDFDQALFKFGLSLMEEYRSMPSRSYWSNMATEQQINLLDHASVEFGGLSSTELSQGYMGMQIGASFLRTFTSNFPNPERSLSPEERLLHLLEDASDLINVPAEIIDGTHVKYPPYVQWKLSQIAAAGYWYRHICFQDLNAMWLHSISDAVANATSNKEKREAFAYRAQQACSQSKSFWMKVSRGPKFISPEYFLIVESMNGYGLFDDFDVDQACHEKAIIPKMMFSLSMLWNYHNNQNIYGIEILKTNQDWIAALTICDEVE